MRRRLLAVISLAMAALLATGCLQGSQGTGGPPVLVPSQAQPDGEAAAEPGEVRVLLPGGKSELAALLGELAALDGNTLTVQLQAAGPGYGRGVAGAVSGDGPPDIIYMEEAGAFADADGTALFAALEASPVSSTRALAGMVPENVRLYESSVVYGLPLGYNALGYLVDIDLLAALLDTQNKAALLEDLALCSWRQWRLLVLSIEQYLSRPGRIQITLGDGTYYTPRYRPGQAQGLRGIFAVPDGEAEALAGTALTAALAAPYADRTAYLQTAAEAQPALAYPALGALMGLLEFETLHMSRHEGAVRRGAEYEVWDKLDTAGAEALFCDGTALFMRADWATGQRLARQQPTLAGRLCLVPVKLPIPLPDPVAETGETEAGEDGETAEEAGENGGDTEETQEPELPDVAGAIARQNQWLRHTATGYLCLNANSEGNTAAHQLLARLFSTTAGRAGLQAQGQLPLGAGGAPATLGDAQLYAAVAGAGGPPLALLPGEQATARAALGEYVAQNLLHKDEWDETDIDGFLSTGFTALGLRVEYIPELVDGDPLVFEEADEQPVRDADDGAE